MDRNRTSAYLVAAMVILLCLVAISGATYALFTSGDDGKIGVNATSGNIDVDIIDTTEKGESILGGALNFVTTSDNQKINFEPGSLYYTEGFRVSNTGEIPINFIIYISEDENANSEELSNMLAAFDVWLTNDPECRGEMTKIYDFKGTLLKGETSDVFYLVFRMKTTAGNEFQNTRFSGIGITVCAVQGNATVNK